MRSKLLLIYFLVVAGTTDPEEDYGWFETLADIDIGPPRQVRDATGSGNEIVDQNDPALILVRRINERPIPSDANTPLSFAGIMELMLERSGTFSRPEELLAPGPTAWIHDMNMMRLRTVMRARTMPRHIGDAILDTVIDNLSSLISTNNEDATFAMIARLTRKTVTPYTGIYLNPIIVKIFTRYCIDFTSSSVKCSGDFLGFDDHGVQQKMYIMSDSVWSLFLSDQIRFGIWFTRPLLDRGSITFPDSY
jgi:hypothetical protein